MKMNKHRFTDQKGSLLVFILWVLLFLSFFAFSVGYSVRQRIRTLASLETRQILRYTAEAGVKKMFALLVQNNAEKTQPDTLTQAWSINPSELAGIPVGEASFAVLKRLAPFEELSPDDFGAVDEERKINLNTQQKPDVLTRLFREVLSLGESEAGELAECILDWIDEDDHSYPSGAEGRYYRLLPEPYLAKNTKLNTLSELLWVKGMTPEIYQKILPYVTVHSSGQVNLNTASGEVLKALGMEEASVKKILSYRMGQDHEIGTADDGVFPDLETFVPLLESFAGLEPLEKENLQALAASGLLTVQSRHFLIRSLSWQTGKEQGLLVECIYDRTGEIRQWQENFLPVKSLMMSAKEVV